MNEFVIGFVMIVSCANLGIALVIAWRLHKLISEGNNIYHNVNNVCENTNYEIETSNIIMIERLNKIADKIPDTFEYNGNKGRIYKK